MFDKSAVLYVFWSASYHSCFWQACKNILSTIKEKKETDGKISDTQDQDKENDK